MTRALRNLFILGAGKGVRVLSGLVLTATMARLLGPEGVARWALLLGAASLLHTSLLGWTQAVCIRFGREEWKRTGGLSITWASRWPFLALGTVIIIILVLANPGGWLQAFYQLSTDDHGLVLAAVLGLWLMAESQILFQVRGEFSLLGYWGILADLVIVTVLLVLAQVGWIYSWGVTGLVVAWVAVWWVGCARSWGAWSHGWVAPRSDHLRRTWRYAGPAIPGFFLGYISDWSDQVIILHYHTREEVGVFQVAYQMFVLFLGIGSMVGAILLPRLIDRGCDLDSLRNFVSSYVPTLMIIWGMAVMPLVALGPIMLPYLLGPRFAQVADIVAILLIGIPGSIVTYMYGALYTLQGRLGVSTVMFAGVMSAINLGISLLVVPTWGAIGAASATAVSYVVIQLLYVIDQHRHLALPMRQPILLLVVFLPFAFAQAYVPSIIHWRLAIAMGGITLLTFVVRRSRLIDWDLVSNLFGPRVGGSMLRQLFGTSRL